LEIDFFIRKHKTATAVEVKSADNSKAKSMKAVIDYHGVKYGIKLSTKNVGSSEMFDSFPLYMAIFL
jgi:hypothetical protein